MPRTRRSRRWRGSLIALVMAQTACVDIPQTYAPPVQRRPVSGPDRPVKHFVTLSDRDAAEHILNDVSVEGEGNARWTGQRPSLRFRLGATRNLRLVADYGFAGVTMQETGPVTVIYTVNGRQLDRVTYSQPGEVHYSKPVPSDWLRVGENVVTLELDKVYVAKQDGARLGVTLSRIGFLD